MPRPPRPDDGRVRRETAPPWRTAHGWVQSRSPLQDMVCRLGCKPIFYSLESRFDNFLTSPNLPRVLFVAGPRITGAPRSAGTILGRSAVRGDTSTAYLSAFRERSGPGD